MPLIDLFLGALALGLGGFFIVKKRITLAWTTAMGFFTYQAGVFGGVIVIGDSARDNHGVSDAQADAVVIWGSAPFILFSLLALMCFIVIVGREWPQPRAAAEPYVVKTDLQ